MHIHVTAPDLVPGPAPAPQHGVLPGVDYSTFTRELLSRVGDKWSVLIVVYLSTRTMRFNALKHAIDGISQRMLTLTLRNLEKDGLVTRSVMPTIPPRIDYSLTCLGQTLLEPLMGLGRLGCPLQERGCPSSRSVRSESGKAAVSNGA